MRALPLAEHREWLLERVTSRNGIEIIEHVQTHGEALFRAIVEHHPEGLLPSGSPRRTTSTGSRRG
jgi:hypothetical protein